MTRDARHRGDAGETQSTIRGPARPKPARTRGPHLRRALTTSQAGPARIRTGGGARTRTRVGHRPTPAASAVPTQPPPLLCHPRPLLPARPDSEPEPVRAGPSPTSLRRLSLSPPPARPRPTAPRSHLRRFNLPRSPASAAPGQTRRAALLRERAHVRCWRPPFERSYINGQSLGSTLCFPPSSGGSRTPPARIESPRPSVRDPHSHPAR